MHSRISEYDYLYVRRALPTACSCAMTDRGKTWFPTKYIDWGKMRGGRVLVYSSSIRVLFEVHGSSQYLQVVMCAV